MTVAVFYYYCAIRSVSLIFPISFLRARNLSDRSFRMVKTEPALVESCVFSRCEEERFLFENRGYTLGPSYIRFYWCEAPCSRRINRRGGLKSSYKAVGSTRNRKHKHGSITKQACAIDDDGTRVRRVTASVDTLVNGAWYNCCRWSRGSRERMKNDRNRRQ
jgi:hypothetical protein